MVLWQLKLKLTASCQLTLLRTAITVNEPLYTGQQHAELRVRMHMQVRWLQEAGSLAPDDMGTDDAKAFATFDVGPLGEQRPVR